MNICYFKIFFNFTAILSYVNFMSKDKYFFHRFKYISKIVKVNFYLE